MFKVVSGITSEPCRLAWKVASGSLEVRSKRPACSIVLFSFLHFFGFPGAILEEDIKEGEDPKIKGSIMLAFAESKADVLKALQEDIYFKEGVWDWHNVQIHPVYLDALYSKRSTNEHQFKSAFRQPL